MFTKKKGTTTGRKNHKRDSINGNWKSGGNKNAKRTITPIASASGRGAKESVCGTNPVAK